MGLGYVGISIAALLSRRGARVLGIDRSEDVVIKVNSGVCPIKEPGMDELVRRAVSFGRLTSHTVPEIISKAEYIILAVGTPLDDGYRPDTSQLTEAAESIIPFLRRGQVLILKSTVPPGATRRLADYISEKTGLEAGKDLHVAFCPERLAEGRIIRDLESIPVIVGGLTPECAEITASFWSGMGWEVIRVSGPEEAEMIKLADNLWIDLNIALANELCMLCHKMDIDVLEVINGANTLPKGMGNVNILFPGPGVGGSCLVKDPWFVHNLGVEMGVNLKLPSAGRQVNEWMPGFIVEVIEEKLVAAGRSLRGAEIAVMGLAFKQNTGDTRFSPSITLVRLLSAAGARVNVFDSWVSLGYASELLYGAASVDSDITSAARGKDAVVFMVGHDDFPREPRYWKGLVKKGCLLLDCRYIFNGADMTAEGLEYISPGRRVTPGPNREESLCKEF